MIGNNGGKAPVLCEGVAATLTWHGVKPEQVSCWALDESGNRRQKVSTKQEPKGTPSQIILSDAFIEMKPEYKTIWYEIEVRR